MFCVSLRTGRLHSIFDRPQFENSTDSSLQHSWYPCRLPACIYVCMYVCMYVCIYKLIYVHMQAMYVCRNVGMQACIYIRVYVCMYVCRHVCVYVCMHAYEYISIHDTVQPPVPNLSGISYRVDGFIFSPAPAAPTVDMPILWADETGTLRAFECSLNLNLLIALPFRNHLHTYIHTYIHTYTYIQQMYRHILTVILNPVK